MRESAARYAPFGALSAHLATQDGHDEDVPRVPRLAEAGRHPARPAARRALGRHHRRIARGRRGGGKARLLLLVVPGPAGALRGERGALDRRPLPLGEEADRVRRAARVAPAHLRRLGRHLLLQDRGAALPLGRRDRTPDRPAGPRQPGGEHARPALLGDPAGLRARDLPGHHAPVRLPEHREGHRPGHGQGLRRADLDEQPAGIPRLHALPVELPAGPRPGGDRAVGDQGPRAEHRLRRLHHHGAGHDHRALHPRRAVPRAGRARGQGIRSGRCQGRGRAPPRPPRRNGAGGHHRRRPAPAAGAARRPDHAARHPGARGGLEHHRRLPLAR